MNRSYTSTDKPMGTSSPVRSLILLICYTIISFSCNSSDVAIRNEAEETGWNQSDTTGIVDGADTNTSETEIVTGSVDPPKPVGLTLGEQLKRLDSLMRIAPADSLEILMTEYDHLIESAMTGQDSPPPPSTTKGAGGEPASETVEDVDQSTATESVENLVVADDANQAESTEVPSDRSEEVDTETPRLYTYLTPRSQITNSNSSEALVQSNYQSNYDNAEFDTSKYNRVRESESKHYQESKEKSKQKPIVHNTSKRRAKNLTKTRPNRRASRSSKPRSSPAPISTFPRRSTTSSLDEKYSEGLAYFCAGSYNQAITELKPVANSSKSYRNTARYYYGLALERTGSLSRAASQFRKLRSGSGGLAEKAWIAYARVLKAQGKISQAKNELLRFIKARPTSSQIASARELLQRL